MVCQRGRHILSVRLSRGSVVWPRFVVDHVVLDAATGASVTSLPKYLNSGRPARRFWRAERPGSDLIEAGFSPVTVAHPAFSSQRHTLRVYHLEWAPATLFACGEFSANVGRLLRSDPAASSPMPSLAVSIPRRQDLR